VILTRPTLSGVIGPAAGIFNPGSFLAGLDWYLDADTILGNDGDPVVDWLDITSSHFDYGQNTVANQPVLKKAVYNGHNAVEFATNDMLLADPTPLTFGANNTLIVICTPSSVINSYIFGCIGSEGNPAFISNFSSTAFEYYNTGAERATFAASASGLHILTVARTDDSGSAKGYYDDDGEVFSIGVSTSNDWAANNIAQIGNNGNGAGDAFFSGRIAAMMHFNQNHAGAAGLANLLAAAVVWWGI
jgi:hypothetical protein